MNVQEEQLHCCQFPTLLTPGWGNSGDFDFLLCRARVDTLYFMSDMIPIKRTLPRDCVQYNCHCSSRPLLKHGLKYLRREAKMKIAELLSLKMYPFCKTKCTVLNLTWITQFENMVEQTQNLWQIWYCSKSTRSLINFKRR